MYHPLRQKLNFKNYKLKIVTVGIKTFLRKLVVNSAQICNFVIMYSITGYLKILIYVSRIINIKEKGSDFRFTYDIQAEGLCGQVSKAHIYGSQLISPHKMPKVGWFVWVLQFSPLSMD